MIQVYHVFQPKMPSSHMFSHVSLLKLKMVNLNCALVIAVTNARRNSSKGELFVLAPDFREFNSDSLAVDSASAV